MHLFAAHSILIEVSAVSLASFRMACSVSYAEHYRTDWTAGFATLSTFGLSDARKRPGTRRVSCNCHRCKQRECGCGCTMFYLRISNDLLVISLPRNRTRTAEFGFCASDPINDADSLLYLRLTAFLVGTAKDNCIASYANIQSAAFQHVPCCCRLARCN